VRGSGTAFSAPEYCFHVPYVFLIVSGGNRPEKTPFPAVSCWIWRAESSTWEDSFHRLLTMTDLNIILTMHEEIVTSIVCLLMDVIGSGKFNPYD
jgi:hypothetical protein